MDRSAGAGTLTTTCKYPDCQTSRKARLFLYTSVESLTRSVMFCGVTNKNVLVVSNYAPPQTNGSAIMLGRLLKGLPKNSFSLITNSTSVYKKIGGSGDWLACDYLFVDQTKKVHPQALNELKHTQSEPTQGLGLLWLSVRKALRIPRLASLIAQSRSIDTVLVTTDNGPFLAGGYLAAKRLKVPLHVFIFDLYADNTLPLPAKLFARFFEPILFRYATTIFVNNRHTQAYLQQKYAFPDGKFVVCQNPILPDTTPLPAYSSHKKKNITFTGNIYWAQKNNLLDLVSAAKDMKDLEVCIYAPLSQEEFHSMGLTGKNIVTTKLTQAEATRAQLAATILFLPMTFDEKHRPICTTASPGKLSDYLTTGRPILVYAPKYSQIARYAKEERFAYVVDQQSPQALKEGIETMLNDDTLCANLVEQSQRLVATDYDISAIQKRLKERLFA